MCVFVTGLVGMSSNQLKSISSTLKKKQTTKQVSRRCKLVNSGLEINKLTKLQNSTVSFESCIFVFQKTGFPPWFLKFKYFNHSIKFVLLCKNCSNFSFSSALFAVYNFNSINKSFITLSYTLCKRIQLPNIILEFNCNLWQLELNKTPWKPRNWMTIHRNVFQWLAQCWIWVPSEYNHQNLYFFVIKYPNYTASY